MSELVVQMYGLYHPAYVQEAWHVFVALLLITWICIWHHDILQQVFAIFATVRIICCALWRPRYAHCFGCDAQETLSKLVRLDRLAEQYRLGKWFGLFGRCFEWSIYDWYS